MRIQNDGRIGIFLILLRRVSLKHIVYEKSIYRIVGPIVCHECKCL